eukprot:7206350-Prymnesium_polylepis.1
MECFSVGLHHRARSVAAWRTGISRILAQHVEHITEIEAYRSHSQQHVKISSSDHTWLRLDEQVAKCAARVEVQPHKPDKGCRCHLEAWHCAFADMHHCLWLGVR